MSDARARPVTRGVVHLGVRFSDEIRALPGTLEKHIRRKGRRRARWQSDLFEIGWHRGPILPRRWLSSASRDA